MKNVFCILLAAVACLSLAGLAHAGPFSLDNLPAHVTVGMVPATVLADIIDDGTDATAPAAKSASVPKAPDNGVAKVNKTLNKQGKLGTVGLKQAQGTTKGACANGQCGR